MGGWQEIWRNEGARRLWTVPDRDVVNMVARWKADATMRRVLDLGCGPGRHVHLLASEGFETYGLDHSPAALEACARWLEADGLPARLRCGEMCDLPFADEYFDAVIAFNSIYHGTGEQVRGTVEQIRRKLRPGGACYVTLAARDNRRYGRGQEVAPDTFLSAGMFENLMGPGEKGVPHHFSPEDEVRLFFREFQIQSLDHEELHLASIRGEGAPTWLRIPKSFFWRVTARRPG